MKFRYSLFILAITILFSIPAQAQTSIASLEPASGLIQHQSASESDTWRTVTENILVKEGDRIRTGSESLAYLTFFEGAQTTISENSFVVISALDLAETNDAANEIAIDILVGSAFTQISNLGPADRVEVHTPAATIAVRGTAWWTIVRPDGELEITPQIGTIEVLPSQGWATAHEAPAFTLTEAQSLRVDLAGNVVDIVDEVDLTELDTLLEFDEPLADENCGDGICDAGEDATCVIDCLDTFDLPNCGDDICDAGEDLLTCSSDCGAFEGAACGDGICDFDESGLTCPADCDADDYFDEFDDNEFADDEFADDEFADDEFDDEFTDDEFADDEFVDDEFDDEFADDEFADDEFADDEFADDEFADDEFDDSP